MPSLTLAPMSGRYLSFAEREEMAILHTQELGVREIARRIGRRSTPILRIPTHRSHGYACSWTGVQEYDGRP